MDFTRLKQLVVPEGVVKKIEIGGKTTWQAVARSPFTSAQSAAIRAGDFTDVPVGTGWTFSNVPYTYLDENNTTVSDTYSGTMRVADCDYYLNTGDTPLTTHHVVVVPDENMFTALMNATNTTAGGYVGSKMRTVYLRRAEAIFKACFGEDHVLKHREYLVNAVVSDKESAGAWYDSVVELMDERMVYGSASYANTSLTSVSNKQLSLFKNNPDLIKTGSWYWLRNTYKSTYFASVISGGARTYGNAGNSGGVRPAALIY